VTAVVMLVTRADWFAAHRPRCSVHLQRLGGSECQPCCCTWAHPGEAGSPAIWPRTRPSCCAAGMGAAPFWPGGPL